jgi:hypothetical protein
MNPIRKLLGLLTIIFIALPVLFAIIIAVGATKAIVSPEILSDIPQDIVKNLPKAVDEIYVELKDSDLGKTDMGNNTKLWLKAILKLKTTPKVIIESSGISKWLEQELAVSLQHMGDILRSEAEPETVKLNLRSLKTALTSATMVKYCKELIAQLPPCTEIEIEEWKKLTVKIKGIDSIPACKPDNIEITDTLVKNFLELLVENTPDKVELFKINDKLPYGLDIIKFVSSIAYALFLIPVIFIIIGSAIGATSKKNFFKWSGYTTISGGLSALSFSSLIINIVPLSKFTINFGHSGIIISEHFESILLQKTCLFSDLILDKLFTPISELGGTVAIIGLLLVGVSYLVEPKETK